MTMKSNMKCGNPACCGESKLEQVKPGLLKYLREDYGYVFPTPDPNNEGEIDKMEQLLTEQDPSVALSYREHCLPNRIALWVQPIIPSR